MSPLILSLISAVGIALLSIIGIITLAFKEKVVNKILLWFVSFSAGALLGGAFFHLLPEAIEKYGEPINIFKYTLVGLCLFFVLERVLRWHHCHKHGCEVHSRHLGQMNLIGDAFHNLIDGIIIFSAFSVSTVLGGTVLLSIALHEIPQEIGDFGVLLYAGYKKSKALLLNLISATTVIMGVLLGYFLINHIENLNNFLLPLAAGGFIYIATSDLIPELHREKETKKSLIAFVIFVIALLFMLLIAEH